MGYEGEAASGRVEVSRTEEVGPLDIPQREVVVECSGEAPQGLAELLQGCDWVLLRLADFLLRLNIGFLHSPKTQRTCRLILPF